MPETDPRKIAGSRVHTKANHVTALAECARRFGARSKTKELPGVAVELEQTRSKADRITDLVVADHTLGGDITKRVKLNIRSVLKEATDSQDTAPLPEKDDAETEDAAGRVEEAQTVAPVNAPTADTEAQRAETPDEETDAEEEEEEQAGAGAATTLVEEPPLPTATAESEVPGSEVVPPAEQARSRPAVTVHDTDWHGDDRAARSPINGLFPERDFSIKTPVGETITRGSDRSGI